MNKKNLLLLADGLEGIPQEFFDMDNWRGGAIYYSIDNCGTVGCAAGWSPFIKGLPDKKTELSWNEYIETVFELRFNERGLAWCFSAVWTGRDNTPQGAALRIRHMVEHGVPSNSFEQMNGHQSYMFRSELNQQPTKENRNGSSIKD